MKVERVIEVRIEWEVVKVEKMEEVKMEPNEETEVASRRGRRRWSW